MVKDLSKESKSERRQAKLEDYRGNEVSECAESKVIQKRVTPYACETKWHNNPSLSSSSGTINMRSFR